MCVIPEGVVEREDVPSLGAPVTSVAVPYEVPPFVENGEKVVVDTRSGEYVERAK